MNATDAASLATAGGTLVLAVATFASVRSANRAARVAERALLAGLRPVLVPSRADDVTQTMRWVDDHWATVGGGQASVELAGDALYLALSLRNVGPGMGVIHGWWAVPANTTAVADHADPDTFRPQTRDLYVPPGDIGYWQAALRDPADPLHAGLAAAVHDRKPVTVELLYGDHEGGQRTITRFGIVPGPADRQPGTAWTASVLRHWNLDRADPR